MGSRLAGLVVALALLGGGCGSDRRPAAAPTGHRPGAGAVVAELASARDTLPPAPPSAEAVTVVLTHPAGASDPGLDAAAAALAERPDIRVVIAAPEGTGTRTMSGFPVSVTGATAADAVATALASGDVELVVVGVGDGPGIGAPAPEATVAAGLGVGALVVGSEPGDPPDLAAATMQLLDVLDLELGALTPSGAVHRLAVPSCDHGMLRGRAATRPAPVPAPPVRSDCRSTAPAGQREPEAFAAGYATLTRLR